MILMVMTLNVDKCIVGPFDDNDNYHDDNIDCNPDNEEVDSGTFFLQ